MNSRIVAALVSSTHSMSSLPSAFFTAAEMVAANFRNPLKSPTIFCGINASDVALGKNPPLHKPTPDKQNCCNHQPVKR